MLKSHFRINEIAGVNMVTASDGSLVINACVVKAEGNQLEIIEKSGGLKDPKELTKFLPAKVPVALNLVGKGILIKQTEKLTSIIEQDFSKILPNARSDDFYLQHFVSGATSYVALIRKEEADKILTKFKESGLEVLSVSLGPFAVQQVFPQLNFYGEEIIFDGHLIQRNEQGDWLTQRYATTNVSLFPVKLETEKIEEQFILPYAAAFQLILAGSLPLIQAQFPEADSKLKSALSYQRVMVISMVVLFTLFVLLLINFVMFSHLSSNNERLATQVGETSRNMADVEKLNAEIKQNEALLDTLGWDGNINKSVLIDRIAQLLPPDVTWQEVSVNPVSAVRRNEEKTIRFTRRTILVKGTTQRIVLVNEWIGRIKSLKWAKGVQLQNYTYDNEENTGEFTVIIDY
jgi:Tfp pilus assembly protein PilN